MKKQKFNYITNPLNIKPTTEKNIKNNSFIEKCMEWALCKNLNQQKPACDLINEIEVINTEEIRESIIKLIHSKIKKSQNQYLIFLPVVSVESAEQLPFYDFSPADQITISPGSEGQIAHWIRNSLKTIESNERIIPPDKLTLYEILRLALENKPIEFVCVTDMCLSGHEAEKFGTSLVNFLKRLDRELPRYINMGIFSISLISSSVSTKATKYFFEAPEDKVKFDTIDFHFYSKSLDDIYWWNTEQMKNVISLCENFNGKHQEFLDNYVNSPLGYDSIGNLTITDFFIPDNTPKLLYQDKEINYLDSNINNYIFLSRYDTSIKRSSDDTKVTLQQLCKKLQLSDYEISLITQKTTYSQVRKFLILYSLRQNNKLPLSQLCIFLQRPKNQVLQNLYHLKNTGLIQISYINDLQKMINPTVEITQTGIQYLNQMSSSTLRRKAIVDNNEIFYYPMH